MFWLLIFVISCVYVVFYRQKRKKLVEVSKKLPSGIPSMPVVGHAYMFAGNDEDIMTAFQKIGRATVKQGGLASYWLVNRLYVAATSDTSSVFENCFTPTAIGSTCNEPRPGDSVISDAIAQLNSRHNGEYLPELCEVAKSSTVADPAAAEMLLKTCLEKDETMNILRFFVGDGSIYAPVSMWRPRRKLLAPTFNIKKLNKFVDVFAKQGAIMVDQLRPSVGNGTVPVWRYLTNYTFYSVCETTLGVSTNVQGVLNQEFIDSFEEISELMSRRMLQPWLHPDFIYRLLPQYKRADRCRRAMYAFVDKVIKLKRQEMEEKQSVPDYEPKSDSYLGFQSLLEMLLETSLKVQGFTDLELREEALVMSAAGTDTSAVGASFTLVMLSRHPEVQERVFEELNDVLDCPDKTVTAADLPRLKYLEAVVKETLRMYPPVPIIVRTVTKDTELQSDVTLPAGTGILLHIWATHRNPRYWGDDADQFRPERFLEPLTHPAQYIPFSYGVRNCLGYQYAMMSMKTVLATVLKEYRILPPEGADLMSLKDPIRTKYEIMMKAVDNFQIQLENRAPKAFRKIG